MKQEIGGKPWRRNPLRWVIWGAAGLVLLLPWVAMQFAPDEVQWTAGDFMVFGAMLAVACSGYELATHLSRIRAYRLATGIALAGAFFMTWANLAVGIVGNESNPANLLFFGVLAVAAVGSLIARFQAQGMARAMTVTALAQLLVGAFLWPAEPFVVTVLTGIYLFTWLASAQLFRRAALNASNG